MDQTQFEKISLEANIVGNDPVENTVESNNPYNNKIGNQILPKNDPLTRNMTGQYTLVRKGSISTSFAIYTLSGEIQKDYKLIIWARNSTAFDITLRINGDNTVANYLSIFHTFGFSSGSELHSEVTSSGSLNGIQLGYPSKSSKFYRSEIDIFSKYSLQLQAHAESMQYTDANNFIHTSVDGIYAAGGTVKLTNITVDMGGTVDEGYYWLYKLNKP